MIHWPGVVIQDRPDLFSEDVMSTKKMAEQEMKMEQEEKEWKGFGLGSATGHEELLKKCKWRGSVCWPNGTQMFFWCQAWCREGDFTIELMNVLCDTSERVEGVTLINRISFHASVLCANLGILLLPYEFSMNTKESKK